MLLKDNLQNCVNVNSLIDILRVSVIRIMLYV